MNVPEWLAGRARNASDIGLAVVFAAVLAFWASRIAESWGSGYWQFGCVAGAVVCLIALLRRRERAWAAIAGLAVAAVAIPAALFGGLPAEPGPAMALGLSVLVGSAVRTLPARSAGAIAAGGLAVVAASLFSARTLAFGVPAVTMLNGAGWLAAVAAGPPPRLLAARRRAAADKVRRDERLALARELHDVVAHHVTGIVLQAQAAQLVARKRPEQVDASLAGIEAAGSEALAAMRRVVGLLRDADGADPATRSPERLEDLVERFGGADGRTVRLRLPDDDEAAAWPPEVTSTVYRVVRESLTNIARHAPQSRTVTVGIAQDRDAVTVEVTDDAPRSSARSPRRRGYGLVGMRERLEALGGTLRAGPREDAGWSVCATLPVPTRERR
ncbi:sensor histidine kinase [Microtetraspora malaysiensis]|uniref:sensor histidine kinase n=1 Tax=Microtetraspora malaysiensis TaxID=161358 RepID=UPI001FDEF8E6|nr:histidine kinase [Microtetraspora malaysiensis]